MNNLRYPERLNPLEQANVRARLRFLGLPNDASRLSEANTRGVVGGLEAVVAVAQNDTLTQAALASLQGHERSWATLGLGTRPTDSVKGADTLRVQSLTRRVKELSAKMQAASEAIHNDPSRGQRAIIKAVAKEAGQVRRSLLGAEGRGAAQRSMIAAGLADPREVTLLGAAVTELASHASVFLGQVSQWRAFHAFDVRNKLPWMDLKKVADETGSIVRTLMELSYELTSTSSSQGLVRSLLPRGVAAHDLQVVADTFDRILKMRPDLEVTALAEALDRRLKELDLFGDDRARSAYIMEKWGHLVPQGAYGSPYELLAHALQNIAGMTSAGGKAQDPFDIGFDTRGLLAARQQTYTGLTSLPTPNAVAALAGPQPEALEHTSRGDG